MAGPRVALVTGSTSGIGAAVARRLTADGFTVALHSRSSVAAGRSLAAELANASYTQADLAVEADARRLVRTVLDTHRRLDVLVNNAVISGIIPHGKLGDAPPAVWRTLYDVNVIAPWVLITEAEPALRRAAEAGRPVAPGLVDTPMTAGWTDSQTTWRDRAPMRRAATPADIADVIAALVASDYLTGEVVVADGGLNLT